MTSPHHKLPKKPSDLIELALADLRSVESDPRYQIDMNWWVHRPKSAKEPCEVCLAGAVMVRQLGVAAERDQEVLPDEPGIHVEDSCALQALNWFRTGDISRALNTLDLECTLPNFNRVISPYFRGPEKFYSDMHTLVADLREKGM